MKNLENEKKDKEQDIFIVNFANQAITNIEVKRNIGKSKFAQLGTTNIFVSS